MWVVRDHVEFAAPDLLGYPNTYVLGRRHWIGNGDAPSLVRPLFVPTIVRVTAGQPALPDRVIRINSARPPLRK